jgi:phage tail-like protein
MANGRTDPYAAFRYAVEIEQIVVGGFSEIGGLAFESDIEAFREGGNNDSERQLVGAIKAPSRLVLRRGLGDATGLWEWFRDVVSGRIERRDVSVLLVDAERNEQMRWKFVRACPVKWSGPELKARSSEVAVESIEFVHEGLAP